MRADELFQKADEWARAQVPPAHWDSEYERLRAACLTFFQRVPEPPLYRRAEPRAKGPADTLSLQGADLLARALVLARTPAAPRVEALVKALRAQLEAQCEVAAGRLAEAERAWRQAQELEAEASYRPWAKGPRPAVYDRRTGRSRFDARDDSMGSTQLPCPNVACRQVSSHAHPQATAQVGLTCPRCQKPFWAYFARVLAAEVTPTGKGRSYRLSLEERSGAKARLEFEDESGSELVVAPRDVLAFLYTHNRELKGVHDLSSGRVLWVSRGGCFVVTAVYGAEAEELAAFRRFRDRSLMRSAPGRALVRVYGRVGPYAARWVGRHPPVAQCVRWALDGVHGVLTTRERAR